VFRASTLEWLIRTGPGKSGVRTVQWGLYGDVPVSLDFDGDGVNEIVAFRPGAAVWNFFPLSTASAPTSVQFGLPGDEPLGGISTLRVF
jgi:hypothetical protein